MKRNSAFTAILMAGGALALAACSGGEKADASKTDAAANAPTAPAAPKATGDVEVARATLNDAVGQAKGSVDILEGADGLLVRANLTGSPGTYALHVHTVGKCDAPDFKTAEGHWNPENKQHGVDNPAGSHKGDMPNVTIAAAGKGTLEFRISGATKATLLDTDGAAFVMHEKPDDNKSDPAGNAGNRIACGIITAV